MARRKISEINKEMDEINNRKPSQKQIEDLAKIVNEEVERDETQSDEGFEKIASTIIRKDSNVIEQSRI
jgi:hypothetical protein